MNQEHDYHGHPNYVLTWAGLVALLVVSLAAASMGHKGLALLVIFGIAAIKAGMVVANFMHLRYEPRLMLGIVIFGLFVGLAFFLGVYPDIVPIPAVLAR